MLDLLHFQRLGIGAGSRLLAEDVLSGTEGVDGDDGVHPVGGADGDRFDLGIVQGDVVVLDGGAAAVLFNGGFRTLGDDVAEILDLCVGIVHVGRDVGVVGNGAAADHRNFDFAHGGTS